MAAIRRRDTKPEKRVRSLLHRQGLRFRVDRPIRVGAARPVRPDIVFAGQKLAVFIDGCYWHGCAEHGHRDQGMNAAYWNAKIARNQERDAEHNALLQAAGWTVLRLWEHEAPAHAAAVVAEALKAM